MMKFLIEYSIAYDNNRRIGKDDKFYGDGVFYIIANDGEEARKKSLVKIRKRFIQKLKINIDRIEEAGR